MPHRVNRRRPRLVDRKFQLGLAWRMMIVYFALFLGAIVLVFAPSMYMLATGRSLNELEPAAREFLVLHYRVWPAAILMFGGGFAYSLYFSRRIAGPIHRINETLRRLAEGESPGPVTLRRGDFFQDTAEILNRLAQRSPTGRRKGEGVDDGSRGPAAR